MKINLPDLAHTIARAAPLLGSAFAGTGGAAVGHLIAAKFGGDLQSPEALHALIQADPEAAIKLKQIENDHEVALQQLTLQAAAQAWQETVHDRSSAREREAAVAGAPGRDKTPALLAYLLTFGVLAALLGLFYCTVPANNQTLILGIVSSLTTVWISAMGYYHGSLGNQGMDFVHHLHHFAGTNEAVGTAGKVGAGQRLGTPGA